MGDGRWGISSGSKDPTSSQVDDSTMSASDGPAFDFAAAENHVWRVVVDPAAGRMNATAVGKRGALSGRVWEEVVLC